MVSSAGQYMGLFGDDNNIWEIVIWYVREIHGKEHGLANETNELNLC